jgi:hypothetical protein
MIDPWSWESFHQENISEKVKTSGHLRQKKTYTFHFFLSESKRFRLKIAFIFLGFREHYRLRGIVS